MAAKILIIEDTESLAILYQNYLILTGAESHIAGSAKAAKHAFAQHSFDLVLLDVMLPDANGMEVLEWINENTNKPPVIVMTAHGTKELIVQSMQLGAADFVEKPLEADRLRVTVNNALKLKRLEKKVEDYSSTQSDNGFCGMVGGSPAMQAVYQIIRNAASSKASVFITGESGTGKELCAEALHKCSDRKNNNFVALNCAAIPKDLIESEIFGHVKGAFTGATANREGAAGQADGGTLFFDEICEMDLNLQSKLLRFIQTGTYQKVGAEKLEQVDVRFVCATNRDPWEEVQKGNFREDLYYRLHVVPIHLPPLRQRDTDVIAIANAIFSRIAKEEGKTFKKLTSAAESLIQNYTWPGNVRQLENTIRNVVVMNNDAVIDGYMFPPLREKDGGSLKTTAISSQASAQPSAINRDASLVQQTPVPAADQAEFVVRNADDIQPMWLVEKHYIESAIKACAGNISKAAAALDINPSTIYRKMKDWDRQ
ncbi:sigma-54-dependent transcriptional regulator [Aestuariibacter salexigens]|uniref:sigma-54-dependent transcriptional regulator n=1 Tax=Aestuariibacter salexigens TaxID=226010 RepID=UPI00042654AE|nr:sigma-54 dependent transcriptional regulator [Aestuariibacter salexigens]